MFNIYTYLYKIFMYQKKLIIFQEYSTKASVFPTTSETFL